MERIEYRTIDKSGWQSGPWDNEPDKIQWPDQATGLPCLIIRGPYGNWCGYVGVPPGHPAFGQDYNDGDMMYGISVHGGLTFSGACGAGPEDHAICHRPGPGEPDHVHWFGFDAGHAGDSMPSPEMAMAFTGIYRDQAYMEEEVRELARQLAEIGGK